MNGMQKLVSLRFFYLSRKLMIEWSLTNRTVAPCGCESFSESFVLNDTDIATLSCKIILLEVLNVRMTHVLCHETNVPEQFVSVFRIVFTLQCNTTRASFGAGSYKRMHERTHANMHANITDSPRSCAIFVCSREKRGSPEVESIIATAHPSFSYTRSSSLSLVGPLLLVKQEDCTLGNESELYVQTCLA